MNIVNFRSAKFITQKLTDVSSKVFLNRSYMKDNLKCYPRECLCSHNLNRINDEDLLKWYKVLGENKNWCPYNPDGSKKKI